MRNFNFDKCDMVKDPTAQFPFGQRCQLILNHQGECSWISAEVWYDKTNPTLTFGDLSSKPTNPKDMIGSDKLPLHLWPEAASIMGCLGLLDGALKYGRSNWRESGVRVSIYIDACRRHLAAYFEGEDTDPDSGLPHLCHALACLAIIVDAGNSGKLTDDRQYRGRGYGDVVKNLTPHVKRLKEKYTDRQVKHWSIQDEVKP